MRKLVLTLGFMLAGLLPAAAQTEGVSMTWPPSVYHLTGVVQVRGTASAAGMQAYFLEVSDYTAPTSQWIPVSLPSVTPVTDGVLASWDTRLIPDGIYTLRLHVRLSSGESVFDTVAPIRVANAVESAGGEVIVQPTAAVHVPAATEEAPSAPDATPTLVGRPAVVNDLPVPVGGQVTYFEETTRNLMQQTGMTWVKWQIPFGIFDPNFVPVVIDRINQSHAAGFNVLLSITGELGELRDLGEDYYPIYAAALGKVAEFGPDAIEVWNEMNIDREWPSGRISSRAYVEMLRQAYTAIKAVDPQVMVITGALAPTGFFGGCTANGCDDGDYYFNMANNGAAQYADCIGVHYNEGILPPQQRGGDPRGEYPTRYFVPMSNRASNPFVGSDIPLCYTELGYLSPEGFEDRGPLPAGFAWASSTSVAEQSEWLRDVIQLAAEYENREIAMIIVFNVDFDRYEGNDPQAGYAIIRPDGTCPACETISSLLSRG